jgi:hypothetical protein
MRLEQRKVGHFLPRVPTEAMAAGGDEAKRAFDAMVTMSQKSSLPQAVKSVSQALMSDTRLKAMLS